MKTRVHTIVWGFLLLGIAVLFLIGTLVDLSVFNPAIVIVFAVVALGAILVLGGIVGAIVRAARRDEAVE